MFSLTRYLQFQRAGLRPAPTEIPEHYLNIYKMKKPAPVVRAGLVGAHSIAAKKPGL
jgi:hypothetical protein